MGRAVKQGKPDRYVVMVTEGKAERRKGDWSRVRLGQLAAEVDVIPGNHSLEEYAKDISVGRSSLFEYRQFVMFYPQAVIEKYLSASAEQDEEKPVTYSMMREAMRGRDLGAAVGLLERWWDNLETPDSADYDSDFGGHSSPGEWERIADCVVNGETAEAELTAWLKELGARLKGNKVIRFAAYKEREKVATN